MAFDKSIFAKLGAPSVTLTLTQGDVSVDLQVCYDMNAAAAVKQKLGKSLFSPADLKELDPSDWTVILWAGLQRYQRGVSVDDVGAVMTPGNYQYIVQKCMDALTITLPKDAVDPQTEPTTEPATVQA